MRIHLVEAIAPLGLFALAVSVVFATARFTSWSPTFPTTFLGFLPVFTLIVIAENKFRERLTTLLVAAVAIPAIVFVAALIESQFPPVDNAMLSPAYYTGIAAASSLAALLALPLIERRNKRIIEDDHDTDQ